MRLNPKSAEKLKAGNTVWRCLIWFNKDNTPRVEIEIVRLIGVKHRYQFMKGGATHFRMKQEYKDGTPSSLRFLSDIGRAHCYDSYRQAKRFEREVYEGRYQKEVEARRQFLKDFCF